MKRRISVERREGHPIPGGLLLFGATLFLAGCGGAPPHPEAPAPAVDAPFANPLRVYRDLGLVTGPDRFPAVASLDALGGPGDSTTVLLGLSLPASALQFQRSGTGFAADYLVSVRASRDGQVLKLGDWRETVRVPGFGATGRTDEAVVFQTALTLEPGEYALTLRVRDGLSARGFETTDTVTVPAIGRDRGLARPVLAYRAGVRASLAARPGLLLNPRRTAAYGGDPVQVYVERYGDGPGGEPLRVSVRTEEGAELWARDVELSPGTELAAGSVGLPVDSLPLGRHWLTATWGGTTTAPVAFLVTISDDWLGLNFDQVLDYLRYIATGEELEPLATGPAEERRARWDSFWAARDPVPATPVNEYRETFFQRLRVATEQFAEGGRPGWRTERGEVYIVLGPPSELLELRVGHESRAGGRPDAQEWVYDRVPGGGRLSLVFVDRDGFGAYRLTDGSSAAFRAVARRLRTAHSRE